MKRKRKIRAKNKIQDSPEGAVIKAEPVYHSEAPGIVLRSKSIAAVRSTLFNAELEQLIDMIARERVYRAMLAGLGRRLLMPPTTHISDDPTRR